LVQENYQEEKACDKRHSNITTTTTTTNTTTTNNNNNAVNRPFYIRFTHRKKSLYIKARFSLKSRHLFLKNFGFHERGVSFNDTFSY
jgi:hypothetical protein